MIVYRIRRRADGLFSMGGTTPHWNKTGKVWKTKGALSNHLNIVWRRGSVYANCDIVTYELTETESDVLSLDRWLEEKELRKREQEAARQVRREAYEKERRRAEFERLRLEFDPQPGEVLTLGD